MGHCSSCYWATALIVLLSVRSQVIGGALIRKEVTSTRHCEEVLGDELKTTSNMVRYSCSCSLAIGRDSGFFVEIFKRGDR